MFSNLIKFPKFPINPKHLQVRPSVKSMHTLQATQTRMETYISKPLSINKFQKLDEQIGIMIL